MQNSCGSDARVVGGDEFWSISETCQSGRSNSNLTCIGDQGTTGKSIDTSYHDNTTSKSLGHRDRSYIDFLTRQCDLRRIDCEITTCQIDTAIGQSHRQGIFDHNGLITTSNDSKIQRIADHVIVISNKTSL